MKIGGGGSAYMQHGTWKGVGGHARVHGRGGGQRGGLAPLEMGKKMLSEDILISHLYFTN